MSVFRRPVSARKMPYSRWRLMVLHFYMKIVLLSEILKWNTQMLYEMVITNSNTISAARNRLLFDIYYIHDSIDKLSHKVRLDGYCFHSTTIHVIPRHELWSIQLWLTSPYGEPSDSYSSSRKVGSRPRDTLRP